MSNADAVLIATHAEPMVLACPNCGMRHVDKGDWAKILHRVHTCAGCGATFQPANIFTVGVADLEERPVCGKCGDSGFEKTGRGYGDVCTECGGQSASVSPCSAPAPALETEAE